MKSAIATSLFAATAMSWGVDRDLDHGYGKRPVVHYDRGYGGARYAGVKYGSNGKYGGAIVLNKEEGSRGGYGASKHYGSHHRAEAVSHAGYGKHYGFDKHGVRTRGYGSPKSYAAARETTKLHRSGDHSRTPYSGSYIRHQGYSTNGFKRSGAIPAVALHGIGSSVMGGLGGDHGLGGIAGLGALRGFGGSVGHMAFQPYQMHSKDSYGKKGYGKSAGYGKVKAYGKPLRDTSVLKPSIGLKNHGGRTVISSKMVGGGGYDHHEGARKGYGVVDARSRNAYGKTRVMHDKRHYNVVDDKW